MKESVLSGRYLIGTKNEDICVVRGWENAQFVKSCPTMYEILEIIKTLAIDPDNRGMHTPKQQCTLMDTIYKLTSKALAKAEGGTPNE